MTERLSGDEPADVRRAAELLRDGHVVAVPTDTVYGLAARPDSPDAVRRLRALKQRPPDKPFAVLVCSREDAERMAVFGEVSRRLADRFWPGPVTIVVPAKGSGGEVGLRCPDLAVTREVTRLAGSPLAAPSANVSGEPPPLTADQVLEVFGGRIAAVLDAGTARLGLASTVVRVASDGIQVLRRGAVPEGELRAAVRGTQMGSTGADQG